MDVDLPEIKDQFDTDSVEQIVLAGFPENEARLAELISWSCFPNDPVCWLAYPYIASLRDDILAPAMAAFLDFHVSVEQHGLIEIAFDHFINERDESFRKLIFERLQSDEAKVLFSGLKPPLPHR